jgi:hypothetical protein
MIPRNGDRESYETRVKHDFYDGVLSSLKYIGDRLTGVLSSLEYIEGRLTEIVRAVDETGGRSTGPPFRPLGEPRVRR